MTTSPEVLPAARPRRPTLRFLLADPAHFIACGCGSGLSSWAPGTVGTLFAWLTFAPLKANFTDGQFLLLLLAAYLGGIWAIDRAGRGLGDPDHGSIVWDEIVPFWLVLLMCPPGFWWQLAAFALFRFYDITKPQPAKFFDDHVKNGFGVMADDLVAAFYSLFSLACLKWILE